MTLALRLLVLVCMLLSHPLSRADGVARWNRIALDTVANSSEPVEHKLRAMATVHVAMFETLNFIQGGYHPLFVVGSPGLDSISGEAAVSAAARHVLTELYTDQKSALAAEMKASLEAIPGRRGAAGGVTAGISIAAIVHAAIAPSRSIVEVAPGRGSILRMALPKSPGMPGAEPGLLGSAAQFRPSGPAALQASLRTQDWSRSIPLAWNPMVAEVIAARGLRPIESARIHALVSIAIADAHAVAQKERYPCAWCVAASAMATILAVELGTGVNDAVEVSTDQLVGREIGRYALQQYFRPLTQR